MNFLFLLSTFSLSLGLSTGNIHKVELVSQENPLFQEVRQKFRSFANATSLRTDEINWNPKPSKDPLLIELCANNVPGNYQNPGNCNQFCSCSSGSPFIWECPGGGSYNPILDVCLYRGSPGAQCPWRSIWFDPNNLVCERPWWNWLTFPMDSRVSCGQDIYFCNKYNKVGVSKCPEGFGYSKAFLACLKYDKCEKYDSKFNLKDCVEYKVVE